MSYTPKSRSVARRRTVSIIAGAVIALATAVATSPATAVPPIPGAEVTIDLTDGLTFGHCKFEVRSVDLEAGTAKVMFTTSFRPTTLGNYYQNIQVRLWCGLSDKSAGAGRSTSESYAKYPVGYAPARSDVWTIPLREDYQICAHLETWPRPGSDERYRKVEECAS